jgi:hypothetical protein
MAIRKPKALPGSSSAARGGSPAVETASVGVTSHHGKDFYDDHDFYLCEWEDTTTTNLKNELKAIYAGLPSTLQGMTADTAYEKVAEVAFRYRAQTYFEEVEMPQTSIQSFVWMNKALADEKKWWTFKHLPEQDGRVVVPCAKYVYDQNAHILNNADLVTIWAHIKFMVALSDRVSTSSCAVRS